MRIQIDQTLSSSLESLQSQRGLAESMHIDQRQTRPQRAVRQGFQKLANGFDLTVRTLRRAECMLHKEGKELKMSA